MPNFPSAGSQRLPPPRRGFIRAPAARPPVSAAIRHSPVAISAPETGNGLWVVLLGFYALTYTVPIAELLIVYWHAHIPVVVIADALLTVGLIMTGRIGAFWKTPLAKPWMALMVLCTIAAVLGEYPRRSVPFILEYDIRFHIVPFYYCAIALSTKKVRHVFSWVGWGAFILLLLCLAYGQVQEGRLAIPDTDMANPNDLGLGILFTMTGLLVLRSRVARVLAVLALPVFLYQVLQTGSRACLVTMVVLSFSLFLLVSNRTKIIMALLIPIALAGLFAVLPSLTRDRLMLLVTNPSQSDLKNVQLRDAMDSQEAREELQARAVQLAVRHPIFGVGALMFQDAVEQMVRNLTGKKSGWQGAHNTYLEVAAENGIPAMLVYIWSLLICFRLNYRAYRTCRQQPELQGAVTQSLALILATVVFAVCTGFSNNAYATQLCVLMGLTAANYLAVEKEKKIPVALPVGGQVPTTARRQGLRR